MVKAVNNDLPPVTDEEADPALQNTKCEKRFDGALIRARDGIVFRFRPTGVPIPVELDEDEIILEQCDLPLQQLKKELRNAAQTRGHKHVLNLPMENE